MRGGAAFTLGPIIPPIVLDSRGPWPNDAVSFIPRTLVVDGDIECEKLDDRIAAANPIQPLSHCHGCDTASVGFCWDGVNDKGEAVERQMCLECLYRCMLVERVRQERIM